MAVNIYDSANQMERDLRQTEQFTALKAAYEEMKQDQATYDLFKDFQEKQLSLQQKQMNGEELADEEVQSAQEMANKVSEIDAIKKLMDKEQAVNQLLNDVNDVITRPIQELYAN